MHLLGRTPKSETDFLPHFVSSPENSWHAPPTLTLTIARISPRGFLKRALVRFADQVAIVTGGAMGIGGATARRLAQDGARVLVADFNEAAAADNVQTIRSSGGTAEALYVDVGSAEAVQRMVEHAVERWGRLDIVVNNAYSGGGHGD